MSVDRENEPDLVDELPVEAKCISCGYLLRGLVVHRCPECGTGFDPADANSYATEATPRVMTMLVSIAAVTIDSLLVVSGGILVFISVVAPVAEGTFMWHPDAVFGSCLVLGFGFVNIMAFDDRSDGLGRFWLAAAIAFDLILILVAVLSTVYYGGITIVVLVLAVIPAGNILALLMIKKR